MKAREADKAVRRLIFNNDQRVKAIDHNIKLDKQLEADKHAEVVVETVTENILVHIDRMPQEELPALLSAMYYYVREAQTKAAAWSSMRKNYRKDLTVNMMATCHHSDVQEIITRVLEIPVFAPGATPIPIGQYDMYCAFDEKIMKTFRENGKFHSSSAYGIVLGCEAQSLFDIPVERIITSTKIADRMPVNVLVVDDVFSNYECVWQWIGETAKLKVSRVVPYMNHFTAMIAAIHDADLIVGPTSMWTYLACCMRKPVYEIYPPGLSKSWLSKWSNPLYAMYVSESNALDRDKLLRGVAYLWQKYQVALSRQLVPSEPIQEPTQTALLL